MKVLIVGFGKMGMLHAATMNSQTAVDEIIICEKSSFLKGGILNFNPSLKVYSDYSSVSQKENIDAAVIAAPTQFHKDIFCDLIQKGIHIFVEKPFVSNLEEAKQCLHAYSKNRVNAPKSHDRSLPSFHPNI